MLAVSNEADAARMLPAVSDYPHIATTARRCFQRQRLITVKSLQHASNSVRAPEIPTFPFGQCRGRRVKRGRRGASY